MTHQGFLQAILAEPDDDTHRLVYADWLDEHGEEERAEFIRVQCELAKVRCLCRNDDGTWNGACAFCNSNELRRRERELLDGDQDGDSWFLGFEGYDLGTLQPKSFSPNDPPFGIIRRGFVESVTLSSEDWLQHGDALVQAAPLREVRLTTLPEVQRVRVGKERRHRRLLGKDNLIHASIIQPSDVREYRSTHPDMRVWEVFDRLLIPHLLKAEWPSVKDWHLPETASV